MDLQFTIKAFDTLSVSELYQLLRLRESVFIIEQNCIYQDLDNKDQKALHVIGAYNGKIVAHSRLFKAGDYFEWASIGRVVIDQEYRDRKWGYPLMEASIAGISKYFSDNKIMISAQLYLQRFYENNGFRAISDVYLEDDIPHIRMVRG
ncbi:MAG: GNAT family N-acetyltransferase [Flavobacterium sp. BFFFF1]|uniref:GNAT family N-acetyltransferase n=1 Tax=Flavobacterium sp. BFFFF1 TaxID=2015557 RepID=UPI000BDA36E2|nr:GNAT family N-acetyltransferase [Flavobacterium sp. BFFFF1]OYU79847.1 MAG: GNAT family N-acetyltransferase [Flavobacterium sp. BFFFF1]